MGDVPKMSQPRTHLGVARRVSSALLPELLKLTIILPLSSPAHCVLVGEFT